MNRTREAGGDSGGSEKRLAWVLGLALAVFLALAGWWVFSELGRARALREELIENYEARTAINQTFSLLQDAETGQRGYVITGRQEFLEPYRMAVARLPDGFRRMDALLADQPRQTERLGRLEAVANRKLAEMDRVIALRARSPEAAEAAVSSGQGKALMDEIRVAVAEMRRTEQATIDAAVAQDRARAERTEYIVALLFLGFLTGSVASIYLVRRYSRVRQTLVTASRTEAGRQRAVFEFALDGIVTLDTHGLIESLNPAAERMFGWSADDLRHAHVSRLLDGASEQAPLHQTLGVEPEELEAGVRREVTGRRKDGSTFPMDMGLVITRLEDGDRIVGFARDISKQREVERMKDEFVSTVSHELRTPLTSIAGSLGLIMGGAAGPLPEKAGRLIGIAQSNCQRLVRLINDVLDMEKLDSGKLPFHFAEVELGEVARRAVDGVRGYADQLGVELALEEQALPWVRGDVDRLVQVATNLISNAAKYTPRGQTVRITVTRDGAGARLSVADRGPGVPEAFRERIFSRFAQADASDARGKSGTGLGLYIAREIAQRHGGRLWFESPETGGAVFHLDVPALDAAKRKEPRDRVLLVEDEPAASALLSSILEQDGLKVEPAMSLAEARELLREPDRFGALVLDLRLPDGDGMDLIRELRRRPDVSMPIVIVSGEIKPGSEREVRALEVVDWMEKPVDPDRLIELVRSVVGRAAAGAKTILHVDDDRDIRELVATALAGYGEVVSVEGMAQAQAFLAQRKPDLVVLDLELRDGSGIDLMKQLVDDQGRPIPVVVFSAQDASDQIGASVAAVLVKSRTSLSGLVGAVKELVDHGQAERP